LKIGIIARLETPGVLKVVRRVMNVLRGEEILLERGLAKKLGRSPASSRMLKKADAMITVGGDGTVLFAQHLAPDVPILGINLGRRGFLAEVKPVEVGPALEKLRNGELQVVRRERLRTMIGTKRLADALNDVVVASASMGKTIAAKVLVDGEEAMEIWGDGVIVATPTGSTAYAHAAGGPLLHPDLKAFVVVPVCASSPRPPSLVVPIDSHIKVEPTRPARDGYVVVDGVVKARVGYGKSIEMDRSKNPALFFKWEKFYRKVRERL